ncbi:MULTISPECIES: anti-sigma factor [Leucobacter]|uniref:Regulator of SigK n=1 Tax=Leucobacter manosquensis TaxID=2810611 RepID=A0ABS5M5Z6_9MICO|nr:MULTISPECIES: anti-sigma factor [Leucobacter]MBS3182603.1 anti-sigma factor [Leucobacter manosquensis]
MNEQQFRELSAARALHALSPEEEQSFSEALAAHPEWLEVVDEDRETVAAIAVSTPEVAPPAGARAAILDLIARSPQFEAGHEPEPRAEATPTPRPTPARPGDLVPELIEEPDDPELAFKRSRRKAAWFGLAASVAVLLAIALALPMGGIVAPQDPVSVALQQVESAPDSQSTTVSVGSAEATLHWSDSTQQAVFMTDGMEAAPENHDYEVWLVRGDQPISLGVMHADANGGAAVLAEGFTPGDALAVTVEDRGGSPTGAPTTDPIVVVASA